jgi:hypothetical protein
MFIDKEFTINFFLTIIKLVSRINFKSIKHLTTPIYYFSEHTKNKTFLINSILKHV